MNRIFPFSVSLLLLTVTALTAQSDLDRFFAEADAFFSSQVEAGLLDYTSLQNNAQLPALVQQVEQQQLDGVTEAAKKAFYINAYNLLVIQAVVRNYPTESVQDIPGFFDRTQFQVAGERLSLNQLEKERLLAADGDARLHFVLVCGALGCPPITTFAYRPDQLDAQLDQQTRLALNDPGFIQVSPEGLVALSQIFQWYASDFGGNTRTVTGFINKYREEALPAGRITYYPYDWSLNSTMMAEEAMPDPGSSGLSANNTARYIVSSTIQKGTFEIKQFNNLYTQRTGSEGNLTDRSTFLTSSLSVLYGVGDRLNVGFFSRYRRVANESLPASALNVLSGGPTNSFRQGLTGFGPQLRWAPIPRWTNFSVQSAFLFAIGDDLAGNAELPFIEWDGPIWFTQVFNDFPIGNNFSLFTEIAFWLEDIGPEANGHINRFSTPATLIFSYNPNRKTTLYTLGGFSPFWQEEFDYFYQAGLGVKYQFTPKLELELLYTDFTNRFLQNTGGQAATYNLGLRINI